MKFTVENPGPLTLVYVAESGAYEDRECIAARAAAKIEDSLKAQGITGGRKFFAEMTISSGGKKNIYYVAYSTIEGAFTPVKGVDVVKVGNDRFAVAKLPAGDFEQRVADAFSKEYQEWLKANNLKQDMSKVLYLCESTAEGYVLYMPLK
ncbi:MAG: hypothetical protein PHW77_01095 [Eubacteriales bacterium]|nr:hypothetical protein [Eubacteriales bacterium]